jgi:hypothetical protein
MIRLFILSASFAAIAACSTPVQDVPVDNGQKSIEEIRRDSWNKIDHKACTAMGGEVRQDGMMGLYSCITPYADAGKVCRDSSDCLGRCKTSDDVTNYDGAPGTQVGKCEINDSPFGCYGVVERGTAGGMLCVD